MNVIFRTFVLFWILQLAHLSLGVDAKKVAFFEKKIRPILVENCYECHSEKAKKVKANLYLDTRAGWIQGGDSGTVIVPKKPGQSLLFKAISYESNDLRMPPDGKLSKEAIKNLQKWILEGAIDPRENEMGMKKKQNPISLKELADVRDYWAFKPVQSQPFPKVKMAGWAEDSIDYFVLANLESKKLTPSRYADKYTLLRRIYFDLIGLPPSPDQINDFISDRSPNAFPKVVDELLGSERFGERWGRHWLDVARYADTIGGGRNNPFPNASRYRDYVVNSFNKDKPFDRFVIEQIAGDLMPSKSKLEYNEYLTGTGFLALGPHNYELQDKELLRMEVVDEQLSAVGRAFMGITMGCARCHDHPFDPIPTKEYYSMAGIFRSTNSLVPGNVASFHERVLQDDFGTQRKEHARVLTSLEERLKEAILAVRLLGGKKISLIRQKRNLDPLYLDGIVVDDSDAKLIGKWISSTHTNGFVGKRYLHDDNKGKGTKSITFSANIPRKGEYDVQVSYTVGLNRSNRTPVTIMHADGEHKVLLDQTKAPQILGAFKSVGRFNFDRRVREVVQITTEGTRKVVIADAIRLVPVMKVPSLDKTAKKSTADSKKNNMLKVQIKNAEIRVEELKNLIVEHNKKAPPKADKALSVREQKAVGDWHVHLRGGIRNLGPLVPRGFLVVATPRHTSPFPQIPEGSSGRLELAHWVSSPQNPLTARVFVNRAWHHLFGRGIVSSTDNFGKMGSRPTHPELLDDLAQFFIDNKWSIKTLIRKIVLSATYQMSSIANEKALKEDPENQLFSRQNRRRLDAEAIRDAMLLASGQITFENSKANQNRSLFQKIDRNKIPEIFTVFDYPNPGLVSGNRNTSTVPTQALFMMNSDFVMRQAVLTAQNIFGRESVDVELKIKLVFLSCLGREPNYDEKKLVYSYLDQSLDGETGTKAMEGLVHSLFACLDFRYLN